MPATNRPGLVRGRCARRLRQPPAFLRQSIRPATAGGRCTISRCQWRNRMRSLQRMTTRPGAQSTSCLRSSILPVGPRDSRRSDLIADQRFQATWCSGGSPNAARPASASVARTGCLRRATFTPDALRVLTERRLSRGVAHRRHRRENAGSGSPPSILRWPWAGTGHVSAAIRQPNASIFRQWFDHQTQRINRKTNAL